MPNLRIYSDDNIEDLNKISDDDEKFIYISALGNVTEDYCDMSYQLQDKIAKEEENGKYNYM